MAPGTIADRCDGAAGGHAPTLDPHRRSDVPSTRSEPRRLFVVGAQRCGTTYLYRLLAAHPEIAMATPARPEPKVFLSDDLTGDQAAYDARVFPDAPVAAVRGEKSTSYLEHPAALDRIAATFPGAHIVVALRDPIERALSNYRFSVDNGVEDLSADEALLADLDGRDRPYDRTRISVSPFAYVRRGRYLPYLQRVERTFASDRVHVVVFEDLVAGAGEVQRLYAALGVDATHRPAEIGTVANASTAAATVSPGTHARLRAHFAAPIAALAAHLGRRLDAWG